MFEKNRVGKKERDDKGHKKSKVDKRTKVIQQMFSDRKWHIEKKKII